MTPIKAIRLFCLECCGGSSNEVKLCPSTTCQLYPFRLGKNPNVKPREITEEQRQAIAKRLSEGKKRKSFEKSSD